MQSARVYKSLKVSSTLLRHTLQEQTATRQKPCRSEIEIQPWLLFQYYYFNVPSMIPYSQGWGPSVSRSASLGNEVLKPLNIPLQTK